MRALVKAEWIKLTTTRTAMGLLLGAAAVTMLGAFSTIMSGNPADLAAPLHRQHLFLLASINLSLFALVLGIRGVTDEFRHGSIVPTLLLEPIRRRVLWGKAVTFAAAGAVLASLAQAAMLGLALLLLESKGVQATVGTSDLAALGGLVAASALWAMIGVAVGAVVRHQVAAVVGALIWVLVVENLGAGLLLGQAGSYLPGQAAHALASASQAGTLLAPAIGALVLGGYALLAMVAATVRMTRADVTTA
jgi:ABC-type transport system involved in multi-copper enzyme maturation permease subunit